MTLTPDIVFLSLLLVLAIGLLSYDSAKNTNSRVNSESLIILKLQPMLKIMEKLITLLAALATLAMTISSFLK